MQRVHVGDTGCASAMVVLQQAWNYLRAFPERRVLAVSVELCSTTYYLDEDSWAALMSERYDAQNTLAKHMISLPCGVVAPASW